MTLALKNFVEFKDLNEELQKKIIAETKNDIIIRLMYMDDDQVERFYGEEAMIAFHQAVEDSESMQTPWFFHEYLYDHDIIRQLVEAEAKDIVERFYWHISGDHMIDKEYVSAV